MLLFKNMLTELLKDTDPSEEDLQGLGLYCDKDILKSIDLIADSLHWTRNTLILESIKHILNLIQVFDNKIIPDFVIQARALQIAGRCNFHLIREPKQTSTESEKMRTGCSVSPIILKKIDAISDSIGYSRNSFISLCLAHTINIVRDELADPLPNIVKIARVCASKPIFIPGPVKKRNPTKKVKI